MFRSRKIATIISFVLLLIVFDACRVKRCPFDNCHIRMRHRHPSMMGGGGEAALVYDANAGPESNLGPVYRGIPWWQRYREVKLTPGAKKHKLLKTRDPKIGQGYKPGYKYKHKDNKPWSQRIEKYKKKKIEDAEKEERNAAKKGESVSDESPADENQQSEDMKIFEGDKDADASNVTTPKESKKERKAKAKKEKKSKKKKEEAPEETEEEEEGF